MVKIEKRKIKRIAMVVFWVMVLQIILPTINEVKAALTDNFT